MNREIFEQSTSTRSWTLSDETHASITRLLAKISSGEKDAEDQLFHLVYDEIHRSVAGTKGFAATRRSHADSGRPATV